MDIKKKKSKNMEHYKSLFFEIGLVVALFLVLTAFEWKSYTSQKSKLDELPYDYIEPETVIAIKTKELPSPPKITTAIKVTSNEVKTDIELFNSEWDVQPDVPIYTNFDNNDEQPQVDDDNEIVPVPPVMPQFPGGDAALIEYMRNNTHYPIQDREIGLQGKVYVSFVVEKNGEVSQVKIERGIGGQCDGEALRVVKNMPSWIPGKNGLGRPVRVKLTLPVNFVLISN